MGKLDEFTITYDHPHGVYRAGDTVKGCVLVQLNQPMNTRSLQLWCVGRGRVNWTSTRRSGKHSHVVHHGEQEIYFDKTLILVGAESGEVTLAAGEHKFDFEIPLDENLPSSFVGGYGYVRYMSKAMIDKPWKFNHDTKALFTVISNLDLNREPTELTTAMQGSDSSVVNCCCFHSGHVTANFHINRRCFVPGECVIINADVHNRSSAMVTASRVSIKQYTEYSGKSDDPFYIDPKTKTESRFVASKERTAIKPGEIDQWVNVPLQIPALPPSRLVGCDIISIAYVIKFYVLVMYGEEIKLACDIIIGTVPLMESLANMRILASDQQARESGLAVNEVVLETDGNPGNPTEQQHPAPAIAPPSYEQSYLGLVHIKDDEDTEYTRGVRHWAPSYPMYRQLSLENRVDD